MSLLLDKWIQSMFSLCLFTLLKVTFDKLKFLILWKVNFSSFSFVFSGLFFYNFKDTSASHKVIKIYSFDTNHSRK